MADRFLILAFLALSVSFVVASDPNSLQDFCVADSANEVKVNGAACKNPMMVQATDFFFSGLHWAGNTSNPLGSKKTYLHSTFPFRDGKFWIRRPTQAKILRLR